MSIDVKINELNSKLKNKLESTTWNEVLVPYIETNTHTCLIKALMQETKEGLKFEPVLKEWFNEFNKPYESIKVAVITMDYNNPLDAYNQEMLHLVLNKTRNEKRCHTLEWQDFNKRILNHLKKSNIVYVFIGEESYYHAKDLDGERKFFLPDPNSTFWNDDVVLEAFSKNVNSALKSLGHKEIKW